MKYNVLLFISGIVFLSGCSSTIHELADADTIYPCTIGCGNENITPPKGYVYYQGKIMSLAEFNRITHQHIIME